MAVDPGLLKAFPVLALAYFTCFACGAKIPSGKLIVNGPRSGYVECECGFVFDPETWEEYNA